MEKVYRIQFHIEADTDADTIKQVMQEQLNAACHYIIYTRHFKQAGYSFIEAGETGDQG